MRATRERCKFHATYDQITDEPTGTECGRVATHMIRWKDGRFSTSCKRHGIESLDRYARALVKSFGPIVRNKEH